MKFISTSVDRRRNLSPHFEGLLPVRTPSHGRPHRCDDAHMPSRRRGQQKRWASVGVLLILGACTGRRAANATPPANALSGVSAGPTIPLRAGPCELIDPAAISRTIGATGAPPRPVQRTDGRSCVFSASRDRTFVLFLHPPGFLREAAARFPAADLTTGDGVVSVQSSRTAAVLYDARNAVVGVYGPSTSFAEVAELAELAEVALDDTSAATTP